MGRLNRREFDLAFLEALSLSEETKQKLLNEQKINGKNILKLLIDNGVSDEETAVSIMGELLNIPQINLYSLKINEQAVDSIPAEMARRYRVIPVGFKGERLFLATADPLDLAALDDVAMYTGREVCPVIAGGKAISYALNHYYDQAGYPDPEEVTLPESTVRETENQLYTERVINEAPVVKLVNSLIDKALEEGASDIHFEPSDQGLRIRMRLDGILHDLSVPTRFKQAHIISRVKIMANLDIAEKRLAQDGNIHHRKKEREINLRVSTMPTVHGEKVVVRLLDKEMILLPLEGLGFSNNNYCNIRRLLLNQSGMVLVTGPTGCGKTTTLYSALHYLNDPRYNIITVEDPVEYHLKGINQVPVNRRINRTFANALRSILRQDPDILMVGEIRDLETVKIATQAALTGHLVLSTLHTNNAAGAVTRLIDMGLEPYMVTASTVGIIAQRLIRKICPYCKEEDPLDEAAREFCALYFKEEPVPTIYRGAKCKRCNHTGFRGRTAIQELLILNQELQTLILNRAPAVEIQKNAVAQGMTPLLADGFRSIKNGTTTLGEVVRVTYNSLLDDEMAGIVENSAFFARVQKGE